MAFFALFMGTFLCESKKNSTSRGEANERKERLPHAAGERRRRMGKKNRRLELEATSTCRTNTKPFAFCIPAAIHERIRRRRKKKHKPKNSLLCCICMQDFLCLFLLRIFLKIFSGKSFRQSNPSQIPLTTDSQAYKYTNQSPAIQRGGTALECKRGIVLGKKRDGGHNNDVLICYMDFVWSRSQRLRPPA